MKAMTHMTHVSETVHKNYNSDSDFENIFPPLTTPLPESSFLRDNISLNPTPAKEIYKLSPSLPPSLPKNGKNTSSEASSSISKSEKNSWDKHFPQTQPATTSQHWKNCVYTFSNNSIIRVRMFLNSVGINSFPIPPELYFLKVIQSGPGPVIPVYLF